MINGKRVLKQIFTYLFVLCLVNSRAQDWNPAHSIGNVSNLYHYSYNDIPDNLGPVFQPLLVTGAMPAGTTYQWEKSVKPLEDFTPIAGPVGTASYLVFSAPLTQTTYFRRKTMFNSEFRYSNTIRIEVVSVNWEDYNYTRLHTINKPGVTDWQTVDNLPISADDKFQTTSYTDGLGRQIQTVSKGTATPSTGSTTWGDIVGFSLYDQFGRQDKNYLPYVSHTDLGRYKTDNLTDQATYYSNSLNETSAYSEVSAFDNSPLNRMRRVKLPGTSWAGGNGNGRDYELNTNSDAIHLWNITAYNTKYSIPSGSGVYSDNSLFKNISTDENGKKVIQFTNKSGQLILKKVQIDDAPSAQHSGWLCTYYVYDIFGRLHCTIEPEAVKYCDNSGNWDFNLTTDPDAEKVLKGYCYFYDYDEKGRMISKRPPGAEELLMLYDKRDRIVFTQDGNQRTKYAAPYKEWMANLYDELDRPVITTLYKTDKTAPNLQADINGATGTSSTISITNTGQIITDLVVDKRLTGAGDYIATNSVELISTSATSFESFTGDEFIVDLNPSAIGSNTTTTTSVYLNPIASSILNDETKCTILKYLYYDNYGFTNAQSFDNDFDNTQAYATNGTTIQNIAKSARTISFPTGNRTRVLNTNVFITSTVYYDDDGLPIQTIEDNIKYGKDVSTLQYHFNGTVLSTFNKHTALGTGYTNFKTLTKNVFDKVGRCTLTLKKYGTNNFIKTASYEYDDIGRLKNKLLSPDYDNTVTGTVVKGIEKLNYSYNIHGLLTGINQDYALKSTGYNKWSHYFGMYLGYDNRDNVFNNANLTGQATGSLWTTQGDDAQRRYDYTYDNAGRLATALFNQKEKPADSWSNIKLDFSVGGSDCGAGCLTPIEYDLNGNIKRMLQKGVLIGNNAPVIIDDLQYEYFEYSNKLKKVTDNASIGTANGTMGDFKNISNTDAYDYDNNGNLVKDKNKGLLPYTSSGITQNGIKYNFLDKPEEVKIDGKGVVKYVYDADGTKLQKIFTADGATNSKITTYINSFTYEEIKPIPTSSKVVIGGDGNLQSIGFEEGRIRVIEPISQNNGYEVLLIDANATTSLSLENGKKGVFDFYIKDNLSNVRMVLTDEIHTSQGTCTMGDNTQRDAVEAPVFGTFTKISASLIPGQPWTVAAHGNVLKLSKNDAMVGAGSIQKVMAGDELNISTDYYYQNATTSTSSGLLTNILANLGAAIGNSASAATNVKNAAASITTNLNGSSGFAPVATSSTTTTTNPRGFLNVLFFDERFNFVSDVSNSYPVNSNHDANIVVSNLQVPKNGYVYIYLSNESTEPVYFDNLRIVHTRGRIVEENHYYPFGLKIAAISSNKAASSFEGKLDNYSKYQGDYSDFEDELNWNDFDLRTYDPQLGRWLQQDPYEEYSSPYTGMGNDPVNLTDPSGGFTLFGMSQGLTSVICGIAGGVVGLVVGGGEGAQAGLTLGIAVSLYGGANGTTSIIVSSVTNGVAQYTAVQVGSLNKEIVGKSLTSNTPAYSDQLRSAGGAGHGYSFNEELTTVANSSGGGKSALVRINTKTKEVNYHISDVSDDAPSNGTELVIVDGDNEHSQKLPLGTTKNVYSKMGYKINDIEGVGMGAVDEVIITVFGGKLLKWGGKFISKGWRWIVPATEVTIKSCFVSGTEVLMINYTRKKIEDIIIGDTVLSFDVKQNKLVNGIVTDIFETQALILLKLSFNNNEVIYTTPEHPFYVNSKWIEAGKLKISDSVYDSKGDFARLYRKEKIDTICKVYNFTVDNFHCYFVGKIHLLVHNGGCEIFIKGVGKVAKELFHRVIKPKVLKAAGNYAKIVGTNPDIFVENGIIFLKGQGPFNGRIFKTTLKAIDFFK